MFGYDSSFWVRLRTFRTTLIWTTLNDIYLKDATLETVDPDKEFEMETESHDYCFAATLNQEGWPVVFISCTLNPNEIENNAVKKEVAAILEAQWQTLQSQTWS